MSLPARTRVVAVVGMPNGGTSLTAGLLSELGFDLGRVDATPSPVRGYRNFECRDYASMVREKVWPGWSVRPKASPRQGCDLVGAYLAMRRSRNPTGALAFKGWGLTWCGLAEEWTALDLDVVHVHRPEDVAIDAYLRYDRRERPGRAEPEYVWAAANLGGQAYVLRRFLERVRPRVSWPMDRIVREPVNFVDEVCLTLDVRPDAAQREAAIAFVRPRARLIGSTTTPL